VSLGLIMPTLVAVAFGSAAGLIRWPVRPWIAMRLLAAIGTATAAPVFLVLSIGATGLLARSALARSLIDACPVIPLHHEVGYLEGSVALAAVIAATVRIGRVLRTRRWAVGGTDGQRISVLRTIEPIAYAVPGKPGCVVVSQGMLDALGPRERQVLFAHERAHLHEQHHRYLLTGELAVAVVPFLRPLADQLRLATERSADEAAAAAVGGDRRLVAQTISKAAITTASYHGLLGAVGGGSVPLRVRSLLAPPSNPVTVGLGMLGVGATAMLAIGAGSVQAHHIAELVGHLCFS
jgi:bla regulator protein blaR1